MKLSDAIDQLLSEGDSAVIFAKKPWELNSEAEIGELDENCRVPAEIKDRGFAYFLEAPTAREVLEVFGNYKASGSQIRALLIYYAENDAYPQWVYDLT